MNLNDCINAMGSTNDAAKRGSMVGYVKKFTSAANTLAALTDDGDYRLAFIQRDGDQFVFTYDASADTFTYNGKVAQGASNALDSTTAPSSASGNALDLTAELMGHLLADDWTVGKSSDFEAVRLPSGTNEW